jgi:hypothetical protein
MSKTIDAVVTDVRLGLRDSVAIGVDNDFSDDELKSIVDDVLVEVSDASPYQVVETALTLANSKILDISEITDLLEIDRVEYPVGSSPREYHSFDLIDNETIELDMGSGFSNTGTSSTLTGTVTFTSGSATVTGSSTLFSSELAAGNFIKPSGGTRWYRIYSIASNTSLTLEETVKAADTGADTVSLTQYRDYVARIYCNKLHLLTLSSSTLNPKEERVVILGSVAKAASTWMQTARDRRVEAVTRIADVNTSIDNMSARVTQALADLAAGRLEIDDERANATTAIDSMSARIEEAIADLAAGRPYINKINIGGNPQNDYNNMAARELQNANTALGQARGYLSESTTSSRFRESAATELQSANTYLAQAGGYTRELTSQINVGRAVIGLQGIVDRLNAEYRNSLKTIVKRKVARIYSRS